MSTIINDIKEIIQFKGKNEELPDFIKSSLNDFFNLKID